MLTLVGTAIKNADADPTVAAQLTISGCVQGVGMRPAIVRVASQLELAGHVQNSPAGVVVVLEGPRSAVESFLPDLRAQLPPEATVDAIQHSPLAPARRIGFQILAGTNDGAIQTPVPRDLAVCPQCLADVAQATNRRHAYPFTSCTDCGPRYSILRALPFERDDTSMHGFALCDACRKEYVSAADRRFHAQTIACADCGPQCWLVGGDGRIHSHRNAAIDAAAAALRAGQIVALKGLGGYQLLVDATSSEAVQGLRTRKGRPIKPLAVMVASLAAAQSLAQLDPTACDSLSRSEGPIVIVPARGGTLAGDVHPGLDSVGLMLPTTPLHWLLARQCPPLVATSGNREGQPLVTNEEEAERELAGVADCFLHHDRPICRAIDDSVVRMIDRRAVTIRAARGISPLPLKLPSNWCARRTVPQYLALGGQQKGAIAVFNGYQAALGPHLGDLDDLRTRERFSSHVRDFCQLYGAKPEWIVHDSHPDYFTTRWAADSGMPTIAVQHHHAHVVAGMIEHGWLDREVLGITWDGTGYGPDGTVWGGEFLRATATGFHRVARLRPFPLIGGEAAIRQPWRAALAVLRDAIGAEAAVQFLTERGFDPRSMGRLLTVASNGHAPLTSSAGRLFDAIAAWLVPRDATAHSHSAFEGHFAMLLEACCSEVGGPEREEADLPREYYLPIVAAEPAELDWRPLVAALVMDFCRGAAPAVLATRFHAALADAIVRVGELHGSLPVVLSGGVFQNRVLVEMVTRRMAGRAQLLGLPGVIPPNDGGLAAGQLAVALAQSSAAQNSQ